MSRHDCNVPNLPARVREWRCPVCNRSWVYKESADWFSTLWHGRDNVRNEDGSKLRWWQ